MDASDKRLLQRKRSYLREHIILTASFRDGLLEIFQREVVDNIFHQQKEEERISMMIDLLCKRDEYAMRDFLHLLRESGHEFIADNLTENRDINLVAAEAMTEVPIDMKNHFELSLSRSATSLSGLRTLINQAPSTRPTGTPRSTTNRVSPRPSTRPSPRPSTRASTRPSTQGTHLPFLSSRESSEYCTMAEIAQDMMEINERFDKLNLRFDSYEEKIRSLEERLEQKEERLRESEIQIKQQQEEISELKEESQRLLHERGEADADCVLTNKKLKELQEKDSNLKRRSEALGHEVIALRIKIKEAVKDEVAASKERNAKENDLVKIKSALQNVKQQNDRLKRRNDRLQAQRT